MQSTDLSGERRLFYELVPFSGANIYEKNIYYYTIQSRPVDSLCSTTHCSQ